MNPLARINIFEFSLFSRGDHILLSLGAYLLVVKEKNNVL